MNLEDKQQLNRLVARYVFGMGDDEIAVRESPLGELFPMQNYCEDDAYVSIITRMMYERFRCVCTVTYYGGKWAATFLGIGEKPSESHIEIDQLMSAAVCRSAVQYVRTKEK